MNELIKILEKIFNNIVNSRQPIHVVNDEGAPVRPPRKPISLISLAPLMVVIIAIFIFSTCTFTVNEMEQAVISRFSEIKVVIIDDMTPGIKEAIESSDKYKGVKVISRKGLFFKLPFIDTVEKYTSQLLTYNTTTREVTTRDKKKIVLDNNAQWKITNPLLFKVGAKSISSANTKLDDIIYSKLNEKIGLTEGSQLISDKEYVYNMLNEVKVNTNVEVSNIGIEVVDVRIAKTELPQENYANIFTRMRTERQKIANKFRSEGEEIYKRITAEAEKEATILRADAYEKSQILRGEGDALASEIFANAYNKDPEFYQFYKTLLTYKETLGDGTTIVIDSKSEFAKYLFGSQ